MSNKTNKTDDITYDRDGVEKMLDALALPMCDLATVIRDYMYLVDSRNKDSLDDSEVDDVCRLYADYVLGKR